MESKWTSTKHRKDTRERFKDRVEDRSAFQKSTYRPWYRQRHNFYPFLMLFVFIILIMIVKAVYNVQNLSEDEQSTIEQPVEEQEPMDYETAKKIFGG